MPVTTGASLPPAVAPAPIAKEKVKETPKPVVHQPVGGASASATPPDNSMSPGRTSALEKGNVTRAYFGEDASMMGGEC